MTGSGIGRAEARLLTLRVVFELDDNLAAPLRYIGNRFTMGRKALIDLRTLQQAQGLNHVALNLKPSPVRGRSDAN